MGINKKLTERIMDRPFTLYSYMNEDKNERSEDLVYISTGDGDGWWESRCNIDDEKEFVIKSDKEYRDAMSELQVLTKHDLGGKNIFPDNFDEKLFSTGKAQYIYRL